MGDWNEGLKNEGAFSYCPDEAGDAEVLGMYMPGENDGEGCDAAKSLNGLGDP